jgi:aspartyl-tRNA(Asn)/glutamyl-tRNA(Gln) amidotransferase subunit C
MASLTPSEVKKIAHLARLAISDEDIPRYVQDLSSILAFVDQMNAVDTGEITPMAHPLDATQRMRADEITEHDQREVLQANAPLCEEGLYLVPKVIE